MDGTIKHEHFNMNEHIRSSAEQHAAYAASHEGYAYDPQQLNEGGGSSKPKNLIRLTAQGLQDGHPVAFAFVGVIVLLLLIAFFFQGTFQSKKGRRSARTPLPAFDVEGNSAPGGGKTLHPSISQAAATADVSVIKQWLADERCNVNATLASDGSTALHQAAAHGHANVCRLLLDGGADVLCVDLELRTALHLVAQAGHGLCVKGAATSTYPSAHGDARTWRRPHTRRGAPCTVRAAVCAQSTRARHRSGRVTCPPRCAALLDAGADPEGKDGQGNTPLSLAERDRHMGTARMMRLHLERRLASDGSGGGSALRRAK